MSTSSHQQQQLQSSVSQSQADALFHQKEVQQEVFFEIQEQIAYSVLREIIPNLQLLKMNFLQRVDVPLTNDEQKLVLDSGNHSFQHAFQYMSSSIGEVLHNEQTLIKTAIDLQKQGKLKFQTAHDTGASLFEELQLMSQRIGSVSPAMNDSPEASFATNITAVVLGRIQKMIQRINEEVSLRWDAEAQVRKDKLVPMDRLVDAVKCQRREMDKMRAQRDQLAKENETLKADLEHAKFRLTRLTQHRYEDYSKFFKELQQVRRSKEQPRDNELFVVDSFVSEGAAVARRIGGSQGSVRLVEVPLSVIVQHGNPDAQVPKDFGGASNNSNNNNNNNNNKSGDQSKKSNKISKKQSNHHNSTNDDDDVAGFDEQDDTLLSFEDMAGALKRSVELEKQLADFKFVESMGIQNSGELISTLQHHQKRSQIMEDRNSKLAMQVDKLQKDLDVIKSGKNKVDAETEVTKDLISSERKEMESQTEGSVSLVAENGLHKGTETEITLMDSLTVVRSNEQQKQQTEKADSLEASVRSTSTSSPRQLLTSAPPSRGDTLIMSQSQFLQLQKPETSEIFTQTRHAAYRHNEMQASVDMQDASMHAFVDVVDEDTQVDFYKAEIAERDKAFTRSKTYHAVVKEELRLDQRNDGDAQVYRDEILLSAADLLRRHGCSEESPIERDLFAACEIGDAILMRLHGCDREEVRFEQIWLPMEDNRPDETVNYATFADSKMRTSVIRDFDHGNEKVGKFIRLGSEEVRNENADSAEVVQVIKLHGCSKEENRSKDYDMDGNEVVDLAHLKVIPIPNDCNGEADRRLDGNEILDRVRFHLCETEEERILDKIFAKKQHQKLKYDEDESLLKPMNELSPESGRKLDNFANEERFFDQAAEDHKLHQDELLIQQELRRNAAEEKKRQDREEAVFRARVISEYRKQQAGEVDAKETQTDPVSFSNRPGSAAGGITNLSLQQLPPRPQSAQSPTVTARMIQQHQQMSSRVSTVSGYSTDDDDNMNPLDRLAREASIRSGGGYNPNAVDVGCQVNIPRINNSNNNKNGRGGMIGLNMNLLRSGDDFSSVADFGLENQDQYYYSDDDGYDGISELRRAIQTIRHVFVVRGTDNQIKKINSDCDENPENLQSQQLSDIPYFSATRLQREHFTQQMLQLHNQNFSLNGVSSKRRSAEIAKKNVDSLNSVASKLDVAVLGAAQGVVLPAIDFLQSALDASSLVNAALEDVYENTVVKQAHDDQQQKVRDEEEEQAKERKKQRQIENGGGEDDERGLNNMNQQKQRHLTTGKDYSVLARARRNRKVAEAEVKCWDAISQIQSTVTKVSRELLHLESEFGTVAAASSSSSPSLTINGLKKQEKSLPTLVNESRSQFFGSSVAAAVSTQLYSHNGNNLYASTPIPQRRPDYNNNNNNANELFFVDNNAQKKQDAEDMIFRSFSSHHEPSTSKSLKIGNNAIIVTSPSAVAKTPPPPATLPPLKSNFVISSLAEKMHGSVIHHQQRSDFANNNNNNNVGNKNDTAVTKMKSTTSSSSPASLVNPKTALDDVEAAQVGLAMVGISAALTNNNNNNNNNSLFGTSSPHQVRSIMRKRLEQQD